MAKRNGKYDRELTVGLAEAGVWIVIPAYKAREKIFAVLAAVPAWVEGIVVVDDLCPEGTGKAVASDCKDSRVRVVFHAENKGVGGATMSGYREAVRLGAGILVKVDADDQMDLGQLPALILPIVMEAADYTKGNRFSATVHVQSMPTVRVLGNAMLALLTKVSSGYWNVFDPTNGYTAIDARVVSQFFDRKIEQRFLFESDMLYHLGSVRAVVRDVPMPARYGTEVSTMRIERVIVPFIVHHTIKTIKRFGRQYVIRDFNAATLETILGLLLIVIGASVSIDWFLSRPSADTPASPGLVMGAVMPVVLGLQFLLAALNYDMLSVPQEPIHPHLRLVERLNAGDDGAGSGEREPATSASSNGR